LIAEKNFSFVAVEGDWPDCYRLNRYIKNYSEGGKSAFDVLHSFNRWPTWMWANWEIVALAEWLRGHNAELPEAKKVGFYGLDVYSLWDSLDAVLRYLERQDGSALEAARRAFRCFEPYEEDVQEYARATVGFVPGSCEAEVVQMLSALRRERGHGSHGMRELRVRLHARQESRAALDLRLGGSNRRLGGSGRLFRSGSRPSGLDAAAGLVRRCRAPWP
jgi:erythromycin esterase-like protein